MVTLSEDEEGKDILIIDPSGVYLSESVDQADFRIFGQQRLKRFGFNLVQNGDADGRDHLIYRGGLVKKMPLQEDSGILTLPTKPLDLDPDEMKSLNGIIDTLLKKDKDGNGDEDDRCIQINRTSLIMNEAYLTDLEKLLHWRTAHRLGIPPRKGKGKGLNENCTVCNEGKRKTRGYKRKFEFQGLTSGPIVPYQRLYCDGYGGQASMGDVSCEGAVGGFVFACPTGSIKTKLYGTTKQFSSILFQVLQEIEAEGFVYHELYVGTFSVNLSKAAEDVPALYRVKIIPISAGTPQEMAYAESAFRVIGEMSRTLLAGAKHLPKNCWGLASGATSMPTTYALLYRK
jgi:hypothetical protein